MMIVKIGGGATINLPGIVQDLVGRSEPMIIVHGANALRDEIGNKIGQTVRTITALSGVESVYSDDALIDLMFMSYSGLRNKRLVELCQRHGINALGLTGLDGRLIEGERNGAVRIREGGKTLIVRDNSGKPRRVNVSLMQLLLENGYTPVITVPICDAEGRAINTDNDDIIALLHRELHATTVLQFIEAPGLLQDKNDPASLISHLSSSELSAWEARVEGRMRRKIIGIRTLFEAGASKVIIADGRRDRPLTDALAGHGSVIQ